MLANHERKAIIETMVYLENNSDLNALYDIPIIETLYSDEELIDYKANKINPLFNQSNIYQFTHVTSIYGCVTIQELTQLCSQDIYYIDDNEYDVLGALHDTEYQLSDFHLYYFNNYYIALFKQ